MCRDTYGGDATHTVASPLEIRGHRHANASATWGRSALPCLPSLKNELLALRYKNNCSDPCYLSSSIRWPTKQMLTRIQVLVNAEQLVSS